MQVAVNDNGPGISLDEQEKIFEKFYQVGEVGAANPKARGAVLPFPKRW